MNCPICNGKMTQDLPLFFCESCDFLYKSEPLTIDEEFDRYEKHNNTRADERYVQYMKAILDSIASYIHGDVLDYGSGKGFMLEYLIGADSYDLFYAPEFPNKQYDTLISIETIEHFINPYQEIKKMVSLVKPGGNLILRTQFYLHQGKDWYYLRDETHRSFYSVQTFQVLAKSFGLSMQFTDERSIIVLKREG